MIGLDYLHSAGKNPQGEKLLPCNLMPGNNGEPVLADHVVGGRAPQHQAHHQGHLSLGLAGRDQLHPRLVISFTQAGISNFKPKNTKYLPQKGNVECA